MTLMLPHFVDALIQYMRGRESKLVILDGAERSIFEFAMMVDESEKFDFGPLHLEEIDHPDLGGNFTAWGVPETTPTEREFFLLGLVPLPAPICWYEFVLGSSRSGLMIDGRDPQCWKVNRIDFDPKTGEGTFDGCWVHWHLGQIMVDGPAHWIEKLNRSHAVDKFSYAANLGLAEYLTLMINSRTTETRREEAPTKLNIARKKAGKARLPTHTIVTIIPLAYRTKGAGGKGTHGSPRLHWRRSHKRRWRYKPAGGRSVWAPEEVWLDPETGQDRKGWWITIVPRFLVGRADLGEISHEYRVTPPQERRKR